MVLFDALTEFLKKQALKGANEIIGYYSKKYKTYHHGTGMKGPGIHEPSLQSIWSVPVSERSVEPRKGAHVVGHYADVARLVGLTENELYTQLKNIKQHANLSKFLVHSKFLKASWWN